jgi:feruloyl esterase
MGSIVSRHHHFATTALALATALLDGTDCLAQKSNITDPPPIVSGTTVANSTVRQGNCVGMMNFLAPSVEITSAINQPAGPFNNGLHGRPPMMIQLPAHCLVTGVIERRIGVGGKPYGIHFEMRMPANWNHRFLFQGGGGINGYVAPAIGSVKGPSALVKGYAVVTQDAGHSGRDASFGEDQQARIDMIYRSYDRVTQVAKLLLSTYYGQAADRSYFMGCSEGGREALLVSQRQPLDYDGVVVGDPGMLLGASLKEFPERMTIASISPKGADGKPDFSKAFSNSDLTLLQTTVMSECDALDGLKDGIIDNAPMCRPNLERLLCKGGQKTDQCLSKPQVGAVHAIFEGGRQSGVGLTTVGYYYNSAIDSPAWQSKFTGRGVVRGEGVNSIQGLFSTPYAPSLDDNSVDVAHGGFDRFVEVGALNRTDGVMYSSFKQHGGKMLMYTGLADQAFSAKQLVDYYGKLASANGGADATANFARLFLAPNMMHCGGGQALDTFDPLEALVEWVEHDKVPTQLIATGQAFPGRSRPICAYPSQSRYKGSGSIEDAANFECRLPTAGQ